MKRKVFVGGGLVVLFRSAANHRAQDTPNCRQRVQRLITRSGTASAGDVALLGRV